MKLRIYVDGGARGNPGPAAAAAVICDAEGDVIEEASKLLGTASNNVAEYEALLLALQRAQALGADELELIGDSELIARQVMGRYKVKHPDMQKLHRLATETLKGFRSWTISTVPRAQNAHADALVNAALDGERTPPAAVGQSSS